MNSALVVIDVQNEYVTGGLPIVHPRVDGALEQIGRSIEAANERGIPVVLVRHTETDDESTIFVQGTDAWQLHESVSARPHDVVIDKQWPGSFTDTTLGEWLSARDIGALTIVGFMTHMCVDTTTRQANHLGLDVTVLTDATGTIDVGDLQAELVHQVELGVLASGFATLATTDEWVASVRGE